MKPGRIENLARHFLYDYTAHVSQEYENLYRMEQKLRTLAQDAANEALEEAALECALYSRQNRGDAQDAADELSRRIRNLKKE